MIDVATKTAAGTSSGPCLFSDAYGHLRRAMGETRATQAREAPGNAFPETALQYIWRDRLFLTDGLRTDGGQPLRILSPGWWNHSEGPDFRDAQIEFNGDLLTGDVEIHFTHAAWTQHGHNRDKRYNDVILVVAFESTPPKKPLLSSAGKSLATLSLVPFLEHDLSETAQYVLVEDGPRQALPAPGHCTTLSHQAPSRLRMLVELAGEWRILNKARAIRDRIEYVGEDQAIYEALLSACGYGRFTANFRAIAQGLRYDRVRQLVRRDAQLLETAFLQIAGLLPEDIRDDQGGLSHLTRLQTLLHSQLEGLRSLPLTWRRSGVRPVNGPERRLAGAARLLARTAEQGLAETLWAIWIQELSVTERRRSFESLFPSASGFWATHCTWTGAVTKTPCALLGKGRVRSVIGNVFVPAALALARQRRDRGLEERVLAFFTSLPKEPANRITDTMKTRILGETGVPRVDFRIQQGLLQFYEDWCASNPSCHNCPMLRHLTSTS